jgi:hypothetical protein
MQAKIILEYSKKPPKYNSVTYTSKNLRLTGVSGGAKEGAMYRLVSWPS